MDLAKVRVFIGLARDDHQGLARSREGNILMVAIHTWESSEEIAP